MNNLLPREKLVKYGVSSLTDDELLAIMLSSGIKGESVFELSKRLIKEYGFEMMFRMDYKSLSKISGIKEAKATKLLATFEITRRIIRHESSDLVLNDAEALFKYVESEYLFLEYEVLTVIYVNSKLNVIKKVKYTDEKGSSIDFPIRNIVDTALKLDSYGIFLVHNHPGGYCVPSDSDIKVTEDLNFILKSLGIHLFDHLIIARGMYYSFTEKNKQ